MQPALSGTALLRRVEKSFARDMAQNLGMPSDVALYLLGNIIGNGMATFASLCEVTPQQAELEIKKLLLCIPEYDLFEDADFFLSLRLALCDRMIEAIKSGNKDAWGETFPAYLSEIFPKNLAHRIAQDAIGKMFMDLERGGTGLAVPSVATRIALQGRLVKRLQLWSDIAPLTRSPASPSASHRSPGDSSWMDPCPSCKKEKRCFQNTKRFHCECGFESPYPL